MSSTSADPFEADGAADHVVRPRPRKPATTQLSHLSQISNASDLNGLRLPETPEHVTGMTR